MTDCPHEHEPDTGLQTFKDIVREEFDGGRDLVRFFTNAMSHERYMFKDEPWNYMYTVYSKTLEDHTFATDGHDPFIYDSDTGRYVPADDRLRPFLADYMKHEWSPARIDLILTWYRDRSPRFWDPPPLDRTVLYDAYKDWCVFNRFSPESARRFYGSIWDIFRIKTYRSHGRRLFKGIQLLPVEEPALNAVEAGAQGAQRGQE